MSIRIDPEFQSLIPPLSADEFNQLEQNILTEGIRDPLVVWEVPNGDMILLDGHNRFEISTKHSGIPFQIKKMHLDGAGFGGDVRAQAKAWIIRNQFGRRNLSAYDRSVLALKLKPLIKEKAKAKEHERKTTYQKSEKSSLPTHDTTKELAKVAGVSHDTIHKVETIESKGSDALKEQVRSGDKSINQAWLEIKERERKQEDFSARARLEEAAERHEDFKNSETVTMQDVKQDKQDQKELARGKSRELRNAVKSILFIGAAVYGKDTDYSMLRKNLSPEEIWVLQNDLGKAVNILSTLLRIIGGGDN